MCRFSALKPDRSEVSEAALLKDIVLAFQGITGRHIYYDGELETYALSPQLAVPGPIRTLACKLTELGWLYNQLQQYCETCRADLSYGLSGQVCGKGKHTGLYLTVRKK